MAKAQKFVSPVSAFAFPTAETAVLPARHVGDVDEVWQEPVQAVVAATAAVAANVKASRVRRITQNGINKPIRGLCADVWAYCAAQHAAGAAVTVASVLEHGKTVNWNVNNAKIEFYQWRKFHGITA